jgi:Zn-dependent protease
LDAVFYAFYRSTFTLMLGIFAVISKLTGFGFMFFVPGYVGISGNGTHLQFALTAFAGPFLNLVLWLLPWYMLKYTKYRKKHYLLLMLTQRINMFLFIFNMLPIPGFDGYKVFTGLIRAFIG